MFKQFKTKTRSTINAKKYQKIQKNPKNSFKFVKLCVRCYCNPLKIKDNCVIVVTLNCDPKDEKSSDIDRVEVKSMRWKNTHFCRLKT